MDSIKTLTRQEKVLVGGIVATAVGVLLMLVSISTDYWVELIIPGGQYRNSSQSYVLSHHSGLWRICRTELDNRTVQHVILRHFVPLDASSLQCLMLEDDGGDYCTRIKLFPSSADVIKDPEIDTNILDYSRSETAFAVISLGLMGLGIIFSVYAVKEPRYMFKRLAGVLHVMTAICILVSAEVLISSINYESQYLPARHPDGAYFKYGYSFGLVWVVFAIFVIAALINFYYGKKRKGERALSDKEALENEPVHLGRF